MEEIGRQVFARDFSAKIGRKRTKNLAVNECGWTQIGKEAIEIQRVPEMRNRFALLKTSGEVRVGYRWSV